MPLSPFPLNIKLFSRRSSILNIYCFDILMWIPPPTEHLTASHAGPKILNLPFPSPFRTSQKLWKIVLLPYHSLPKPTCSWCPPEPLLFLFSVFSWLFLFFRLKKKHPDSSLCSPSQGLSPSQSMDFLMEQMTPQLSCLEHISIPIHICLLDGSIRMCQKFTRNMRSLYHLH